MRVCDTDQQGNPNWQNSVIIFPGLTDSPSINIKAVTLCFGLQLEIEARAALHAVAQKLHALIIKTIATQIACGQRAREGPSS